MTDREVTYFYGCISPREQKEDLIPFETEEEAREVFEVSEKLWEEGLDICPDFHYGHGVYKVTGDTKDLDNLTLCY